jgi:uncharacterized protein (DUF885 family)
MHIRICLLGLMIWPLAGLTAMLMPSPSNAEVSISSAHAPSSALKNIAERFYEAQASMDPVYSATLLGDNRFDDQLAITIAPSERKKRFEMYRLVQAELARIPKHLLGQEDTLTYGLLARDIDVRLGFERFDDDLLPLQQMNALPAVLANFGSGQAEQPIATVAQYDAYLKRILGLPMWTEQAIANMREGMRRGVVPPKYVVTSALAQLRMLGDEVAVNPFYAPITRMPVFFTEADRQRLINEYRDAVAKSVAPAMRKLCDFVEKEYLPASRETVGWADMPDGAAWYRQWIRAQTSTNLSPEEIHSIGLREVGRIQEELAKAAPKLGYAGNPRQLLAWTGNAKASLPFQTDDQILATYRALNDKVRSGLPQMFKRVPEALLEVAPQPQLSMATAVDRYSLAKEDGTRPAIFWVAINDPATYDATVMTAKFLRAGQPGYHFQMAIQHEIALPTFRKRAWINAFREGWALYAASLGKEMGLYLDPATYVGELRLEISSAAHLVVDTGIHAKKWTHRRAVDYLVANVGLSESQAQSEVEQCMAWPGQVLGEGLGSLKIRELRERAKGELGVRFNISEFHDAVLGEGALPLDLLDSHIERWIALERKVNVSVPNR